MEAILISSERGTARWPNLACPGSKNHAVERKLLALPAASLVLAIVGCCSCNSDYESAGYQTASAQPRSGWQSPRLGAPVELPPTPHCEVVGPKPDTVDVELWARLKLDYERHCYQRAEMLVRKRLQRLLTSGRLCGGSISPHGATSF